MSQAQADLVARVTRGDQSALGELLRLYQARLYNVCLRMVNNRDDAAEITQDAMLKIIEHIDDYNGSAAISTWMTRITMNLAISHLRKRKLRQAVSLDNPVGGNGQDDQASALRDHLADNREPTPLQSVQQKEMVALLHQALGLIDEELRAVIVLRDINELDYREIAEVLGIPVGTVKSRLFRARLALRHEALRLCPPAARIASKSREDRGS